MSSPRPPLYRLGDAGGAVAEIRSHLTHHGLLAAGTDTPSGASGEPREQTFDTTLDRAVRTFQQLRGLTVDGVVGPQTYRGARRGTVAAR